MTANLAARGDAAQARSLHALGWLNFFTANVQTGFGLFISSYLALHKWTQGEIGLVLSVGTISAMLSQVPGGAAVDALRNKKAAAAWAVAAIAMSAVLLATSPSVIPVMAAEIFHGFASCMLTPAIAALALALVGRHRLGDQLGRNARWAALGSAIAAALMGLCGQYFSLRAVFWLTAALALPALAALAAIRQTRTANAGSHARGDAQHGMDAMRSAHQENGTGTPEHAHMEDAADRANSACQASLANDAGTSYRTFANAIRNIASVGRAGSRSSRRTSAYVAIARLREIDTAKEDTQNADAASALSSPGSSEPDKPRASIFTLLRDKRLLVFAACTLLFHLSNAAMANLAAGEVTVSMGDRVSLIIAACIIVSQAVVALMSPWVGRSAERWGRRPVLILGFCALPVRALLFASIGDPYLFVPAQIFDGLSGAVFGVMLPLIAADVAGNKGRYNLCIGLFGLAMGIGATLSTTAAGFIADHFGNTMSFMALAAVGALAVLVAWLGMPETRDAR